MNTETAPITERSNRRSYVSNELNDAYSSDRLSISWSAIFAGVVIGTAVQAMLALLGIGIGASTIDPTQEANPMAGLGIGAAAWMFVSTILAYYAAGWFSGRSIKNSSRMNGALHGVVTWGASTVAIVLMLSGVVGGAASGATRLLGSSAQLAYAFGVPQVDNRMGNQQTEGSLNSMRQFNSEQADQTSNAAVSQPTESQVRQAGEKAATGTAATGFFGFAVLLLSAIAAGFGGAYSLKTRYATPRPSISN